MIHPKIKNSVRDVLMNIGFKKYFLQNGRGSRMILLHGIDKIGNLDYNSRYISVERFDDLLTYFKKHFNIVTLEDFCNNNYPKDKLTITITFDDGLANNYYRALPILEKHQVPASFFITGIRKYKFDYLWPDFIDLFLHDKSEIVLNNIVFKKNKKAIFTAKDGTILKSFLRTQNFTVLDASIKELIENYKFNIHQFPSDYFLQMTEEEIRKMSNHPLVTIGSHGMYHTDLTKISLQDAKQEIMESKIYLESVTGKQINAFAFPFDVYNQELIELTKKAGYKFVLPSCLQSSDKPVQRFGINPYISFYNQLYYIYKGNYA